MISESPYIWLVENKQPEPDPDYVHDLVVLRAMVRQEHRQGDIGWGGSWTKGRYQQLRDKHPEALLAFEAELRWEREEAQLRRETLVKYKDSPYIEAQKRAYPANPDKDRYLKSLERLRHIMILFKLGHGSREMSMLKVNSKSVDAGGEWTITSTPRTHVIDLLTGETSHILWCMRLCCERGIIYLDGVFG